MKLVNAIGVVALLVASGCQTHSNKSNMLSDNFDDTAIGEIWSCFSNGCSIAMSDGELKIQGTTVVDGWGNGSGLTTEHSLREGDFNVSIDFSVPEFSGSGTRPIYLMAKGGSASGAWAIIFW